MTADGRPSFLVASHYTPVEGTTHHLLRHLRREGYPTTAVLEPLTAGDGLPYRVVNVGDDRVLRSDERPPDRCYDVRFLARALAGREPDVFVGVDPLNAFAGVALGRLLGRDWRSVFYAVDFSPDRFDGAVKDALYHRVERLATAWADRTWCSSAAIADVRRAAAAEPGAVRHVPNGSWLDPSGREPKRLDGAGVDLVYVGSLGAHQDLETVVEAVNGCDSLSLDVYGDGPTLGRLRRLADGDVTFHGLVPHERLLPALDGYDVGVAPYGADRSHVAYGASLKLREYLSAGLPVVTTDAVGQSGAIARHGAGTVYRSPDGFERALRQCVERYERCSRNALSLAERYYWPNTFERAISELLDGG